MNPNILNYINLLILKVALYNKFNLDYLSDDGLL